MVFEKSKVPNRNTKEDAMMLVAAAMGDSIAGRGVDHALEEHERAGQGDVINSTQIPIPSKEDREALTAAGVVFCGNADDLFIHCELPDGWEKRPTDHHMYSNLVDDKGRLRGSIMYKSAMWDRDASLSVFTRFHIDRDYAGDKSKGEESWAKEIYQVKDRDGTVLLTTEIQDSNSGFSDEPNPGRKECEAWLEENYPNWKDMAAYWDE